MLSVLYGVGVVVALTQLIYVSRGKAPKEITMSGRSIGLAVAMFAGVRVTGPLTYIPAHINAQGKRINAKCTIPVAKNSHKGTRPDET